MSAACDPFAPQHTASYVWPTVLAMLPPPPARVLDAGCGNGAFARTLISKGYEVVGFDSSASAIRLARDGSPAVEARVLAVEDQPPRAWNAAFDVVTSLEVIEHLYRPRSLAERAYWELKPAGVFVLSTPYHGYLKNVAIALAGRSPQHFDPLCDGGHIKFFTPSSLTLVLNTAGFSQIRLRFAGRLPWLWKSMVASARTRAVGQLAPGNP